MRKVSILMIITGLASICAAVLSLEKVTNIAQCNFLANMTILGIVCAVFGIIFLIQNLILQKIRKGSEVE